MKKISEYIRASIRLQTVIVWLVVFILTFVQQMWIDIRLSLVLSVITICSLLIIYYATQKILVPKLLIKGRKVGYIILSLIIVVPLAYVCARLEIYTFQYFEVEPRDGLHFIFSMSRYITLFILTYAVSNIIFFSKKTTEDAKQKEKLLSEKKMLEVRVLKSQINSHFIFNALNNIYSMIYFKDEYTSGYVLKLAQMMRYVMEDCDTEFTPLLKEIEYIENFIDFQKLRFENDKNIVFNYSLEKNSSISVPPMLFQPLVENCFKHTSLEVDKSSYVHISLSVKEKRILFISDNSQPLLKNKEKTKGTEIGIENVRRRLSLYYGKNYEMDITDNAERYRVKLLIFL